MLGCFVGISVCSDPSSANRSRMGMERQPPQLANLSIFFKFTQPLAAGIACEPFPVGSRSLASVHSKPPGLTTSETLHPAYARHRYKRPVRSVGGISLRSTYHSKVSPIAIRSSPWFDSIPSRHAKLLVHLVISSGVGQLVKLSLERIVRPDLVR